MSCTRCEGNGYLNVDFDVIPAWVRDALLAGDHEKVRPFILDGSTSMSTCDCCGDGQADHHGEPGHHAESDLGKSGPYAYNGGLPECA